MIAGPFIGETGLVSAIIDLGRTAAGRRMLDPTGHDARPDVLSLNRPITSSTDRYGTTHNG